MEHRLDQVKKFKSLVNNSDTVAVEKASDHARATKGALEKARQGRRLLDEIDQLRWRQISVGKRERELRGKMSKLQRAVAMTSESLDVLEDGELMEVSRAAASELRRCQSEVVAVETSPEATQFLYTPPKNFPKCDIGNATVELLRSPTNDETTRSENTVLASDTPAVTHDVYLLSVKMNVAMVN